MKTTPTPSHPPRQTFLEWYHVATLGQTLQRLEGSYLRSSLKLTYNEKTLQVGYLGSETLYVDADFIGGFVLIEEGPTAAEIHGTFARGRAEALPVATESIVSLLEIARRFVDRSILANRRSDGLFHSYNLLALSRGQRHAEIDRLPEMLEGQVAVLSSGLLSPLAQVRCAGGVQKPEVQV